jgi:hypothetical protein
MIPLSTDALGGSTRRSVRHGEVGETRHGGDTRVYGLANRLNYALLPWARNKFKGFKRSYRRSERFLDQLRAQHPYRFMHWYGVKMARMRRAV